MFDATNATKAGTDQGYCVRVVAGTSYECTWTTILPGGQIVVAGPFYDAKDSTLAITGGTGRYRDARGTMELARASRRHGVRLRVPPRQLSPAVTEGARLAGALGTRPVSTATAKLRRPRRSSSVG